MRITTSTTTMGRRTANIWLLLSAVCLFILNLISSDIGPEISDIEALLKSAKNMIDFVWQVFWIGLWKEWSFLQLTTGIGHYPMYIYPLTSFCHKWWYMVNVISIFVAWETESFHISTGISLFIIIITKITKCMQQKNLHTCWWADWTDAWSSNILWVAYHDYLNTPLRRLCFLAFADIIEGLSSYSTKCDVISQLISRYHFTLICTESQCQLILSFTADLQARSRRGLAIYRHHTAGINIALC